MIVRVLGRVAIVLVYIQEIVLHSLGLPHFEARNFDPLTIHQACEAAAHTLSTIPTRLRRAIMPNTDTYSEERETLRGVVARYENDIATARDAGQYDVVDDLLEPALEAQAMLDDMIVTVEHVTPDVPLNTLAELRDESTPTAVVDA